MRIVMLGYPGSGVTTQALRLSEYLGVPYVSVDRVISGMAVLDERLMRNLKTSLKVPHGATEAAFEVALSGIDLDRGFVMDGYPRSGHQVIQLLGHLLETPLTRAIWLNASSDICLERLGKADGGLPSYRYGLLPSKYYQLLYPQLVAGLDNLRARNIPHSNIDGTGTVRMVALEVQKAVDTMVKVEAD